MFIPKIYIVVFHFTEFVTKFGTVGLKYFHHALNDDLRSLNTQNCPRCFEKMQTDGKCNMDVIDVSKC